MNKEFILSLEKQSFKDKYTTCPICGKTFYVSNGKYQYKKKNKNEYTRWACSYSCYKELCEVVSNSRKI